MSKLHNKISIKDFSIEEIDISPLDDIMSFLPKNGVVDVNVAERGLIYTLEGQNFCQEKIVVLDRWIGFLEGQKNKAWSSAALDKAKQSGHKTVKDKEWFAQANDDYIDAHNNLVMAKACKKWFENKTAYFSGWHYALKSFLKRDYSIENSSGISYNDEYNRGSGQAPAFPGKNKDVEVNTDDIDWE
tara:strand:- start:3794 stop:4354 length:561 start_codon:yes stop_codon:yes gene_type:complete